MFINNKNSIFPVIRTWQNEILISNFAIRKTRISVPTRNQFQNTKIESKWRWNELNKKTTIESDNDIVAERNQGE